MVAGSILSDALIQLIDRVITCDGPGEACRTMLRTLLEIFKLDQATLFEKRDGEFSCVVTLDRSNRILRENETFSSNTLLEKSLLTMEPMYFQIGEVAPLSVKEDSLRQVICLPLSRSPATVIFLGSREVGKLQYSPDEMKLFKTAARASWLAMKQVKTQENLAKAEGELRHIKDSRSSLVFSSPSFTALVEELDRVSQFNVSILLLGESGVGKEELARHIHQRSGRKGAFVAINCANLSESLLDSELFGYHRGAFTGATQAKDGLFKIADGGTLFLDEIGELPFNLQAKLLRAIQERTIRPVGATKDISVDVRIVSATQRNLEQEMSSGGFRSDLFYRVQEFGVTVPALRDRTQDIELLAEHFLALASIEMKLPRKTLSSGALQKLICHTWPGNVRELKSICRTAMILARENEIQENELRFAIQPQISNSVKSSDNKVIEIAKQSMSGSKTNLGNLRNLSREFEKNLVKSLLDEGLNQVEIGAQLGVSVRTLQRILNESSTQELFI